MRYEKILGYNSTCVIFELLGGKVATVSTSTYANGIIIDKNKELIRYKYIQTEEIPNEQMKIAINRLNEGKNVKDYTLSDEEQRKIVRKRIENAKRNHLYR